MWRPLIFLGGGWDVTVGASSQKVNFEKSSISFSANVLSDLRAIISDLLAIP